MKRFVTILMLLPAVSGLVQAQKADPQSGVLARLEVVNGKVATAMLQSIDEKTLTFQPYKSTKNIPAPVDKIKSLTFSMTKEEFDFFREQQVIDEAIITEIYQKPDVGKAEKLGLIFEAVLNEIQNRFLQGDLEQAVPLLELVMQERGQYMSIENNLQDHFVMLVEAYRKQGEFEKMRRNAKILQNSSDSLLVLKGTANLILADLAEGKVEGAQALMAGVESEVVKLYLQACIDRAIGEHKKAFQSVTTIIADHGNDVNWLPPAELLSAQLYLDIGMTNSAVLTARQVMNMYAGTSEAADAATLRAGLVDTTEEESE